MKLEPNPDRIEISDSQRDERKDRARGAMRHDGEFDEPHLTGQDLGATKEGRDQDRRLTNQTSRQDEAGDKLDKILAHMDALHEAIADCNAEIERLKGGRDDGAEPEEPEGEEEPGEGAEEEQERIEPRRAIADSRHDSRPRSFSADAAERAKFAEFQARADRVFEAFSAADSAPRALSGETYMNYQRRVLGKLKTHSSSWRNVNLYDVRDSAALNAAAAQIFHDAYAVASAPPAVGSGVLRVVITKDQTGRQFSKFYGDPEATWGMFKQTPRRMVSINLDPNKH
jgi:hypothetical protein